MKTILIGWVCVLSLSFYSFTSIKQDIRTVVMTYDGYEYEEYYFSIQAEDDEEDTYVTFTEMPAAILKEFDLKSDKLVGKRFKISYEVVPGKEADPDDIPEESYVIKSLKKPN